MKRFYLFTFLGIVSLNLFSQTNYSPETLGKIHEVETNIVGSVVVNNEKPYTIEERMKKYKVKGISIAVIKDYKVDWARGYGWADEEEKRPVTTETLFQAASISKAFNAIAILQLVQDKKLDLYTDINTYLTSWKFPYDTTSHGIKITLAHLLSHTAGLSTFGYRGYNINAQLPTLQQVLDGLPPAITSTRIQGGSIITVPAVRSEFEPGLQFQYSGGGTTISQVILTDVTQQAYDAWLFENVLKPLGMLNSTYDQFPDEQNRSFYSSGYYKDGSRVLNKYHISSHQAGGGLWTNPTELCKYIIDMQLAYKGNPSKVLNEEMVKLHLTPYNNGPTSMGSFIEDHDGAKYFQHAAGNDGFCGQFYASLDDGYGAVILCNSEDGNLVYEVLFAIAKAYNWKNFQREPQKAQTVSVPDSILKKYEGIYEFEGSWAAIGEKNKEYYYYTFGWMNYMYAPMYFNSQTEFFNPDFPSTKEFIMDKNNHASGFTRRVDTTIYPSAVKIVNPDTFRSTASVFTDIGWYLLENQNYKESLRYFKRGAQLYPTVLSLLMGLAHCYVFNKNTRAAINIHKIHLDEIVYPGLTWRNLLINDLIYLKEYHYKVKDFDKIFKALKIGKPKGY